MRKLWENIKSFLGRDWTPAEKVLILLCCVLIGMVKGFMLAPVKRGISVGNNNGDVYCGPDEEYWLDEED